MKFIILKSHYMSKDRIILREKIDEYNATATLGYLLEMGTFNKNDDVLILNEDTDSIQIRPKAIYKNSKGYYIKENGKREYLANVEKIKHIIKNFKKILEDNVKKN